MARPAAASSPEARYGRRRDILNRRPWRTRRQLPRRWRGDDRLSGTWLYSLYSLSTVNGVPHPVGCCRHFQLVVADRIGDGVDDGGGCADCAGLAATLDAQGIARTQRRGVGQFERWQVVGARHGVVHERCGHELAGIVVNRAFQKRLPDALGKTAMHLALDDHWIDHPAKIVGGNEVDERSEEH